MITTVSLLPGSEYELRLQEAAVSGSGCYTRSLGDIVTSLEPGGPGGWLVSRKDGRIVKTPSGLFIP